MVALADEGWRRTGLALTSPGAAAYLIEPRPRLIAVHVRFGGGGHPSV